MNDTFALGCEDDDGIEETDQSYGSKVAEEFGKSRGTSNVVNQSTSGCAQ